MFILLRRNIQRLDFSEGLRMSSLRIPWFQTPKLQGYEHSRLQAWRCHGSPRWCQRVWVWPLHREYQSQASEVSVSSWTVKTHAMLNLITQRGLIEKTIGTIFLKKILLWLNLRGKGTKSTKDYMFLGSKVMPCLRVTFLFQDTSTSS